MCVCVFLNMRLQKVFCVFYLAQNMFAICNEMLNENACQREIDRDGEREQQRWKSQNQRNKYLPNNSTKTHTILCLSSSHSLSISLTLPHSVTRFLSLSIHMCAEIRDIIFVTLTQSGRSTLELLSCVCVRVSVCISCYRKWLSCCHIFNTWHHAKKKDETPE